MRLAEIENILSQLVDNYPKLSDIIITVGRPFQVESDGELKNATIKPPVLYLTPFQTEIFALNLTLGNPKLIKKLVKTGSCDCSFRLGMKARFRVNIFSQRGFYSIVLRKLSSNIPSIEEMGLPKTFYEMAKERNGLILVTGATGSGKSTSLAAFLKYINENRAIHVVTLEDPIEFEHPHLKATFNQRELGIDFESFSEGLKAALRQAPKVILVGEMRDKETVDIGLTASETGHLVLSTLHTINAGQTINRLIGMFDKDEEELVRMRLAETLRWVVCQRLVPKINGGRIAVLEIMANTLRTRDLILNGETEDKQFYDVIASSTTYGMNTFDQNLIKLYKNNIINDETALSYCSRKSAIVFGLDRIKSERGMETSDIKGLELENKIKDKRGESPEDIMVPRKEKKINFKMDLKKKKQNSIDIENLSLED